MVSAAGLNSSTTPRLSMITMPSSDELMAAARVTLLTFGLNVRSLDASELAPLVVCTDHGQRRSSLVDVIMDLTMKVGAAKT